MKSPEYSQSDVTRLPISPPQMVTRHGSFDIFRAIGAFGVILIHVGLICDYQITPAVTYCQAFFACVVPFFLVTAFYFAARREKKSETPWKKFLSARAERLLIPFALWGIIYTLLRSALYLVGHQPEKLANFLSDPVGLVLFNGGGVMLYFLPLLFIGLLTLRLFAPLLRNMSTPSLLLVFAVFLTLRIYLDVSYNSYSADRAFVNISADLAHFGGTDLNKIVPFRILFVVFAHAIRSLPLIIFSFIVLNITQKNSLTSRPKSLQNLSLLLMTIATFIIFFYYYVFREHYGFYFPDVAGMAAFVLSLLAIDIMPSTEFTGRLGAYTFGIFLCHQVFLTAFRLVLGKHLTYPVNLWVAGGITLLTFIISYLATALAARSGKFSRRLFAIES